jgi:hypothetical protein
VLDERVGLRLTSADNSVGRKESPSECDTDHDDGEKGDVGGGLDGVEAALLEVDAESDETAQERAAVEDGPEDTEGATLLSFEGIGEHDAALGSPEQCGTHAEHCAGKHQEPVLSLLLVNPKGSKVESVSETANEEGDARTKDVVEGSGHQTGQGEEGIEDGVGDVGEGDRLGTASAEV